MAFTKIAAAGIGSTGTVTLENIVVTGSLNAPSITGSNNLNISGVSTLGNTVVGGATTQLIVTGDARITGILTIGTSSVTFDGTNNKITVGSATTIDSTGFFGSGASLTAINASNISSGTLPDARFPATLPAVSGANLTAINASNISSGTLPDARFPATLPAVSGANLTGIAAFPAGTLMLFQQTSAPTGWTKQTTHDNKALRVVSGSAGSGGSTAFTSVFASRTPSGSVSVSGSNSGGSVSNTTLSTTEMPSHTHKVTESGGSLQPGSSFVYFYDTHSDGGGGYFQAASFSQTKRAGSAAAGSSGAHGHGFTNPSWSGSASFSGSSMDFAVQYVDLIIASRN
jgi:hypothetical protein